MPLGHETAAALPFPDVSPVLPGGAKGFLLSLPGTAPSGLGHFVIRKQNQTSLAEEQPNGTDTEQAAVQPCSRVRTASPSPAADHSSAHTSLRTCLGLGLLELGLNSDISPSAQPNPPRC